MKDSLYTDFVVALLLALFAAVGPATSVETPITFTERFIRTYLAQPGYALLEGKNRERLASFLSRSFLRNLDNAVACENDWIRQQPKGSTDKPPFVDCCLFTGSADWFPNSFRVGRPLRLKDGRYEVPVEYRYRTATEDHRWLIAVAVKREGDRFVIDDFGKNVAIPSLLRDWDGCRNGKWVGKQQRR